MPEYFGADMGALADTTEEVGLHVPTDCKCESCKYLRTRYIFTPTVEERSTLKRAVVHSYSYKPRGDWKPKSVARDAYAYPMGVELETDRTGLVHNGLAADMRRPKRFWVAKHDSSVSGPEFASHPATLTWWNRNRKQLQEMFTMLVHAGFRSHDGNRCGMHVNISKSAFNVMVMGVQQTYWGELPAMVVDKEPTIEHLYRFLRLVHSDPAWSLKMSQRTRDSMERWANLGADTTSCRNQAEYAVTGAVSDRFGYGAPLGRYTALNAPAREGRVEFRLPRGTLRLDRFYKNLEWVTAMVEYTRPTSVSEANCNPRLFTKWVMARKRQFPHLSSFINEKFGGVR